MRSKKGITWENTRTGKLDVIEEETTVVVKVSYVYSPTCRSLKGHDIETIEDGGNSL